MLEGPFADEELMAKIGEHITELLKPDEAPPTAPRQGRPKVAEVPFSKHVKIWHKVVPTCDREANTQKFIRATYAGTEASRDRRFAELKWFARKLERVLFDKAVSQEIYQRAVETIRSTINTCMVSDAELREMRADYIIPPTAKLERMFMVHAEMEPCEPDDDMTEGAAVVELIKEDRFKYHCLILKPDFDLAPLPGGYKNETEQRRKQIRRGPNNRKIALARYSARVPVEESCMKISMRLCEQTP